MPDWGKLKTSKILMYSLKTFSLFKSRQIVTVSFSPLPAFVAHPASDSYRNCKLPTQNCKLKNKGVPAKGGGAGFPLQVLAPGQVPCGPVRGRIRAFHCNP